MMPSKNGGVTDFQPYKKTGAYNFELPDGNSAGFMPSNRNKQSICIRDITTGEGKEILHRLVKRADVFLTNLRKSTKSKWGIDYETLSKVNPMIVHANVSGYGPEGPLQDHGAFDVLGQARSGVAYITGSEEPTLLQIGVIDQMTAIATFSEIILGLLVRQLRGFGQELHVSLFSASMWLTYLNIVYKSLVNVDANVKWVREMHPPARNLFKCKDGRWIITSMFPEQESWPHLCETVGREDMMHDERFATVEARQANKAKLIVIFDEIFIEKTAAEWEDLFVKRGIIACTAQTISDIFKDPQALANDYITEIDYPDPRVGKVKIPGFPIHLSKCDRPRTRSFGPGLGEHTDLIMRDIGYGDDEIRNLKKKEVIK